MVNLKKLRSKYHYSIILLRQLVSTDFKLRYQDSFLGYIWSLLRPLALFVILYFVLTRVFKSGAGIEHYPEYLLLGIVLWNFFTEVTSGSVGAIVGKGDLLRKINFPKYVIILASSFSAFINLLLNFIVVAVFMIIDKVDIGPRAILIIPLVLELFVLSLGLAFLLSTLFVRLRDVSYIWDVILQAGFYATPILYVVSEIPVRFTKFLMMNPLAQIIQDARYVLINPKQTWIMSTAYGGSHLIWLAPISMILLITTFSSLYFRRMSKKFAEEV